MPIESDLAESHVFLVGEAVSAEFYWTTGSTYACIKVPPPKFHYVICQRVQEVGGQEGGGGGTGGTKKWYQHLQDHINHADLRTIL